VKEALRRSRRAVFNLLLALLNRRLSCWACLFCHFDLALRFVATKRLMSEGKLLTGLKVMCLGVAACAAC
jgi:hypothetical protein